jgi:hypothetical protein
MKNWHITVTNNETGEAIVDQDTDALLASIDCGEGTRVLHLTNCHIIAHVATIVGMVEKIKEAKEENPLLAALVNACGDLRASKSETEN